MSFLAPLFLLGAAALAGPILFHLIRRTTRERTLFSSLRFLRQSPPTLTRRSRIEHWLLLLLRCLALALLALAFARPYFRKPTPPDPDANSQRRTLLLIDTSASMRRPDLWKETLRRAEAHIRQAANGEQLAILAFNRSASLALSFQQWDSAAPSDRTATALAALNTLQPSWLPTHLGPALVRAAEELADPDAAQTNRQSRIILISDLQEGARLDPLQSYEWPSGIEVVPDPVKPSTSGNASLQLIPEAPDADRALSPTLRVRIANSADATSEQLTLAWNPIPGLPPISPVQAYVPPGQARIVAIPSPTNRPAATPTNPPANTAATAQPFVASLTLSGDPQPFDNTLFVHPPQPTRIHLLYLGPDKPSDARQPLFFLSRALPESRRQSVVITHASPAAPPSAGEIGNARLLIATDALPDPLADSLRARIEAGQTLVFAPASAAAAPTLARILRTPGLSLVDQKPPRYALLGDLDFRHPLLAPFADPRFSDFTRIHFWRYRQFTSPLPTNAQVITRFDSGDPAWVDFPIGRGRLLFLASGWSTTDSQFALSSKFVPWIYSLLDLAGLSPANALNPVVGDPFPLPPNRTSPLAIRRPDGSVTNVPPSLDAFSDTDQPGVWSIGTGPDAIPVAVNLDPAEGRTTPLSLEQLERLGVRLEASLSANAAPEQKPVGIPPAIEAESRQKTWRWLILAALATLAFETFLAGFSTRRLLSPTSAA